VKKKKKKKKKKNTKSQSVERKHNRSVLPEQQEKQLGEQ
jgi:hypothetical protein